jgi:hypothetical protein
VNFEDQVLVRLAATDTRTGVFDQDALASVAAAGFDHPELTGPYTADFTEASPMPDAPRVHMDGQWQRTGDPIVTDLRMTATGLGAAQPVPTVLLRGTVSASSSTAAAPVNAVAVTASDGAHLSLEIGYPASPVETMTRVLPVAVVVLARDAGVSLAGLLAASAAVRRRAFEDGWTAAADPSLRSRVPVVVAWAVPPAFFDDPDWPGDATGAPEERRRTRRAGAATWLAQLGIAVAVVPPTA